ncbi:MAG: nucleotide exchange factor GrpE [Bacteroidales bacterium]|nr:nucleotide exchange factor GrpE [Bacteroidales bacterium]
MSEKSVDTENQVDEELNVTAESEVNSEENVQEEQVAGTEDEQIDKCTELETKLAEMTDKYLRLSADFDNYRKKAAQERVELISTAGKSIFTELLPVVDNFERALKSMESAQDVPALREGVELIYNSFLSFLSKQGVKAIECVGEQFSTDNQTAIAVIPAPSPEQANVVIDCTKKGYTLHDKVLRFAEVVVAK